MRLPSQGFHLMSGPTMGAGAFHPDPSSQPGPF
jgi:hypothetical protein